MPSWPQILGAVIDAWATKRDEIREQSEKVAPRMAGAAMLDPSAEPLTSAVLDAAVEQLRTQFDPAWGGWGGAPKFPSASVIEFLLARGETEMSLTTLRAMARGGLFDQVGGGFARYAVDRTWTIPHFEKMLYDNALLARAYLHGWLVSGDELLRRTVTETLDFIARELRGPEGGFYSALDADSEGVEGRYYVWALDELHDVLGEDSEAAIAWTGATQRGTFEGANPLEARGPEPPADQRERIRAALYAARERRVRPGLDDKRLTAWNALAIAAFAEAGAVLERADYVEIATRGAPFVLAHLREENGSHPPRLLRTW